MITDSVKYGMKLWAFQLIPALFPFMILTSIFLWFCDKYTDTKKNSRINRLLCRLWNLSPNGIYILILGHICGYPSGAKMISERYKHKKISQKEANYLLTISNQSSPAFIDSYLITYALNQSDLTLELFLILYISTFFTSLITRKCYLSKYQIHNYIHITSAAKNIDSGAAVSSNAAMDFSTSNNTFFNALDESITDSAAACIKIGGYIIVFSVLSAVTMQIFSYIAPANQLIAASFELTYGLSILRIYPTNTFFRKLLILAYFSFGGLCTMAQIKGMLVGTSLSIKPYFIGKCIYTGIVLILFLLCI